MLVPVCKLLLVSSLASHLKNAAHLFPISKICNANFSHQHIACFFPSFKISHASKNEWLRWPGRSRVTSRGDNALTTGGVNGVSQFSVLPLAQVVLLHPSCHLVGLHLRTPIIAQRKNIWQGKNSPFNRLNLIFGSRSFSLCFAHPSTMALSSVNKVVWMGILHVLLFVYESSF